MKKFLVLLLILFIIALIVIKVECEEDKVFEVGDIQWIKKPSYVGDVGIVAFKAVYIGSVRLLRVKVSFESSDKSLIEVLSLPVDLSSWSPGEVKVFRVSFKAKKVPCDAYISVTFSWSREVSAQGYVPLLSGGAKTIPLKLSIRGEPLIQLDVEPSRLIQGSLNTLKIRVINNGIGTATNLRIKAIFEGLTPVTSLPLVISVDKLGKGDVFEKSVQVIPVSSAPVVQFSIEYINEYGELITTTVSKQLYATPGSLLYLVPEPSVLTAGKSYSVEIKVVNGGELTLYNLTIHLVPSASLILNTTLLEVSELEAFSKVTIPLQIIVPEGVSGAQAINYEVIYKTGEGSVGRESGTLVFNVLTAPVLKIISFDAVPSKPKVNKTLTVSLTILNTGSSIANNLNVSISVPKEIEIIRRSSMFIGRLEPQVPSSVAFSLIPTKAGTFTLTFTIKYTDIYGRAYTIMKSYTIEIEREESLLVVSESPVLKNIFYIALAALAAIIVVVILLIKKYGVKRK